jgi:thiol-disulfide isomerase/thioredoxin
MIRAASNTGAKLEQYLSNNASNFLHGPKMKGVDKISKMTRALVNLILLIAMASSILSFSALCASEDHKKVGSGDDDWWTSYPAQSPASGSEVNHSSWVLDALKEKPVIIYVHKDCTTCKPQTEALAEIVKEYGDKFTYYNLVGNNSSEIAMAQDAVVYDPNGGVTYVPLTVILTLAPDSDGKVQVVWHSTEEVTGKDWIKEYVEDAISLHEQNIGSWKP